MRPLLQCVALVMAALWLPATQHCTLDSLGIIEAHVQHHDHDTGCTTHGEETQHAHDTCILVEFSSWLDTADTLNAPPPQVRDHASQENSDTQLGSLLSLLSAFQPFSPSALSSAPPHAREHPQNRIPSRHFTERAAPISRAPSPILA